MAGSNNSFSLIEILVVVTIVSLIFVTSFAYYNQFTEEKKLQSEVLQFVDVLHLARQKAVAGEEPAGCSFWGGHQVTMTISDYTLQACCGSGCGEPVDLHSYSLPASITILDPVSPPIKFSQQTGFAAAREITLKNTAIARCEKITVTGAGIIDSSAITCP